MAATRDILRRIRALDNTRKITKAMEMVAAAKLRRAQERVVQARPYARRLAETLSRVAGAVGPEVEHPLLAPPKAERILYVVITGDRGLAGSYNANVIRHVDRVLRQVEGGDAALLPIGRKGYDYYRRRAVPILHHYVGIGEDARSEFAAEVADRLIGLFTRGEVGQVRLVYTEFASAISFRPVEVQLLPIAPPQGGGDRQGAAGAYIFVPSAAELLATLLPKLVRNQVYQALLEAKASEHGARMTAMRNATDNAGELIGNLTLAYNRARQAAITTEISEIVGGAAALNG